MPCIVDVTSPPYNAVGDGIADDTTAIQDAINDVNEVNGGTVWMPEGTYLITNTIIHLSNVTVRGCGYNASIIRKAGASTAWSFAALPGEDRLRAQLSYLRIDSSDSESPPSVGIDLSRSQFVHIHHVQVWDFGQGIVMSDGTAFSAYHVIGPEVEVNSCAIGIRAWANCNACTIIGSRVFWAFRDGDGIGIDVQDTGGLTVIGTTVESADTCLRIRGQSICHFSGNYFEPGDASRLAYDINVEEPFSGTAVIRGESNVYNGDGIARLPASSLHYWDGRSSGSFGAYTSGTAGPKRNLVRNGDLKYWGGFPSNVPNWFTLNDPILAEESAEFVTGTRSVRITNNAQPLEGVRVLFPVSDPGIHWVTVGCRYQVIDGDGFFFSASAGEEFVQYADPNPSQNEWQEGHLQVHVRALATLGDVRIFPGTDGEILVDEVWAVPGRYAVDSTQYGERVELLESPIPILRRRNVIADEEQSVDITDLPTVLALTDPALAGLATAPRGVVGCMLRVRIVTRSGDQSLLDQFHYTFIDIPGDTLIQAQTHRVYSHWGSQPNEEMVVVRSTTIDGGYTAADNLRSDYTWDLVGWILA